jgi:hypothetical protein
VNSIHCWPGRQWRFKLFHLCKNYGITSRPLNCLRNSKQKCKQKCKQNYVLFSARLSQAVACSNRSNILEHEQNNEIDVEQVSNDGLDPNSCGGLGQNKHNNKSHHYKSNCSPSSPKAQTMSKKKKDEKPRMRNKCNSEELRYSECILETKDLWDKFHDYETEMIITKTGR